MNASVTSRPTSILVNETMTITNVSPQMGILAKVLLLLLILLHFYALLQFLLLSHSHRYVNSKQPDNGCISVSAFAYTKLIRFANNGSVFESPMAAGCLMKPADV